MSEGLNSYQKLEKVCTFFDSLCTSLYGGCENGEITPRMDNEKFALTPLTWSQLGEGAYATVCIPHQLDTRKKSSVFL